MPPLSLSTFLSLHLPLKRCIGRALHKCPLLRQQKGAKEDGQKKTAVFSEGIEGLKAEATGQDSEDQQQQQLYTGEVWEEDEFDSNECPQAPSCHRPFVHLPTHQFSPQSAVNIRSISLSFESVISVFVERFTG